MNQHPSHSLADDDNGNNALYSIACEACRNKKHKCDRELPVCAQCNASGTACRYPPINKRGLPSGYISYIERRLLNTELVVYELMSKVYSLQITVDRLQPHETSAMVDFSNKQPKSAKIGEWKNLPLHSEEDRRAWWNHRKNLIDGGGNNGYVEGDTVEEQSTESDQNWSALTPPLVPPFQTQPTGDDEALHIQQLSDEQPAGWSPMLSNVVQQPPLLANQQLSTNVIGESHLSAIQPLEMDLMNISPNASSTINSVPHSNLNNSTIDRWRKYF